MIRSLSYVALGAAAALGAALLIPPAKARHDRHPPECVAARDPATEPLTVVFREGGGVLKATCSTGQEGEWATE